MSSFAEKKPSVCLGGNFYIDSRIAGNSIILSHHGKRQLPACFFGADHRAQ